MRHRCTSKSHRSSKATRGAPLPPIHERNCLARTQGKRLSAHTRTTWRHAGWAMTAWKMGHPWPERGTSHQCRTVACHRCRQVEPLYAARCALLGCVARCADVFRVARMCCALPCSLRVCVACCILRRANTSYFIQKVERRHYLVVLLRDLRSEPARQR